METENAMLYLKLAQLHGSLKSSREELADASNKYEAEKIFRSHVLSQAAKVKEEIKVNHCYNLFTVNDIVYKTMNV